MLASQDGKRNGRPGLSLGFRPCCCGGDSTFCGELGGSGFAACHEARCCSYEWYSASFHSRASSRAASSAGLYFMSATCETHQSFVKRHFRAVKAQGMSQAGPSLYVACTISNLICTLVQHFSVACTMLICMCISRQPSAA